MSSEADGINFQISKDENVARSGIRNASGFGEQPSLFTDSVSQDPRDDRRGRQELPHNPRGRVEQMCTSVSDIALRYRRQFQLRLSEMRRSERRRRCLQESSRMVVRGPSGHCQISAS